MRNLTHKDVAVCICTYKNRYDMMLKHINDFKPFNVYVVCRRNDFIESGYDKYEWDDNVHVILLDNVKNLNETREAARIELTKLGYKAAIMLDDDIHGDFAMKISPESKRETSESYRAFQVPFMELLEKLLNTANEYDASFCSAAWPLYIGFGTPGAVAVNSGLIFGGVVFINLEDLAKHNLKYETDLHVIEDVDIVFQLLRVGCTCTTLGDYSYRMIPYSAETSVVGDENWIKVATFLKWKNYYGLNTQFRKRYNNYVLQARPNTRKLFKNPDEYFKNDAYTRGLYDLCKEQYYGERDITKVIDYINENKNKKGKQ